jgi:hypothetical protein
MTNIKKRISNYLVDEKRAEGRGNKMGELGSAVLEQE